MITRACRYFFIVALLTYPAITGAMDEGGIKAFQPTQQSDCQEITDMVSGFFGAVVASSLWCLAACGVVLALTGGTSPR